MCMYRLINRFIYHVIEKYYSFTVDDITVILNVNLFELLISDICTSGHSSSNL